MNTSHRDLHKTFHILQQNIFLYSIRKEGRKEGMNEWEDSNAEWVLTDLLDKLADKTRKGDEGSEHSPNNRQGMTCRQAGLGESSPGW